MPDFILPLTSPDAADPSTAGTKAANLSRVAADGIPTPGGFVVTTHAFESAIRPLSRTLDALDRSSSVSENALDRASRRVRTALLECDLPRGLQAGMRRAWRDLGGGPVSVRSSSTAEDLAGASFAGQYESYLNVPTFDRILESIRFVWASLHSPHAIGYRRRNGLASVDARMAVLVQPQLDPKAAGVLFTRDPVDGRRQFVVTASLGIGEGVVAGTAEADRYVLVPKSGRVKTSTIAEKRSAVAASAGGGLAAVPVADRDRKTPALRPAHLKRLATIGRRLETLFGAPQDVEFALADNRIQILQARPMTAVPKPPRPDVPWGRALDKRYAWHRWGGPFRLLEQDAVLTRLRHAKDCYDAVASAMTVNHVGRIVNGYLYARPNPVGERTRKKRHRLQTERVDRSLRKGKSYFEDVQRPIIERRLARLARMRRSANTLAKKVAYVDAAIDNMGYVLGNLHWRMGKPGRRINWHETYAELTGEPEHHANVFVGAIQNRMTRVITQIRELARIAQSDTVLDRLFRERDFDALSTPAVARRKAATLFRKRFKAMMRVYGIRTGHGYGTASGWQTPTWNLDHTIPYEFIASYVEQDLDRLDEMERQARVDRERETARVRRMLRNDPDKLERLNEALRQAKDGVRFLEDHNYYMEQCGAGTMREAIHDLGTALVELDRIDDPDDVFHFSLDELREIARERKPSDLRPRVRERVDLLERQRGMNAPAFFGKKERRKRGEERTNGLDGSVIRGSSASSGRVSGPAVVTRGSRRPRIRPGNILVAPNVGPDWTPLFATIGGLVLDGGSLGQHAALVAREYGIPSVMETHEASMVIQNGQRITVDGDAGIVEL